MDTRCCSKNAAARKKRFHSFEIFRCIGQVNLLIRRISLIKEQGSHIFEELCQDLGDIFSIVHELIEEIQGSRQIAAANFLYQGPHRIAPGNTKDLPHRFSCHGISHDTALIQKTNGIAHAPIGLNGHKTQGIRFRIDIAAFCYFLQVGSNIVDRNAAKIKTLTPGMDGRRDLLRLRCRKDKDDMLWRLFKSL